MRHQNFAEPMVVEYERNPRTNLAEVKKCIDYLLRYVKPPVATP